jgi:hypothetical protein
MNRFPLVCISLLCLTAGGAVVQQEGFENDGFPTGWIVNSVDITSTYAFTEQFSSKFGSLDDELIIPLSNGVRKLIFHSYTTSSDPSIHLETASSTNGPWTEFPESPFSGNTQQWNQRSVDISLQEGQYIRLRKSGSGSLYLDELVFEDGQTAELLLEGTSRVDGRFYGWRNDTIIKLKTGHFWQNIDGVGPLLNPPLRCPTASVTNLFGQFRMTIDGVPGYQVVQPIDVKDSFLNHPVTAYRHGTIYSLADGTLWKQISFETGSTSVPITKAWRWESNNQTMMRLLDVSGAVIATVQTEPLNILFSGSITNRFNGLCYGNRYLFDDPEDWVQLSFETKSGSAEFPEVIAWEENNITRMLIYGFGSCAIARSDEDPDRDGLSNAEEMIAGSDPRDPASSLNITELQPNEENWPIITWETQAGREYTIEWSPSLSQDFRAISQAIPAPQNMWTNKNADPNGFYRIRARRTE